MRAFIPFLCILVAASLLARYATPPADPLPRQAQLSVDGIRLGMDRAEVRRILRPRCTDFVEEDCEVLTFGEGKRPTIYYRLHNEPLSLVGGRVIFQGTRVIWVTGRHLEADGELVLRPGQREMTALALLGKATSYHPETGGVMTAHWPERRLYIWLRGSFTDNWVPWRTSEFTLY